MAAKQSRFSYPCPWPLAAGRGKEEGINLTMVNGGDDNVMTALITGESDIGFMGSESSIYVYNQRAGDYFINFAQLTPYDKLVTTQFAEEAAP